MRRINPPDMVCCVNCFSEPHINEFIRDEDTKGDCEYCNSKDVYINNVEDVGDFIIEGILRYYEDAAEQITYVSREGGYQYPTKSITEILLEEEDIFGEALDDPTTLVDDFIDDDGTPYVRHDPYGSLPGAPDEIEYWSEFCETVKRVKRFTAFLDAEDSNLFDPKKPKNLLSNLASSFFSFQLSDFPPGTKIYRARIKSESIIYGHKELTSPSLSDTRNSRMSPVGISFFYGGMDSDTCIHEVRPSVGEKIVIAEFEVIKDLSILLLSNNIERAMSKYNPDYEYSYEEFFKPFLRHFITDISRPIRDTDSDVEYVPTQVFTEFIKSFDFDMTFSKYGSDNNEDDPVILDGLLFPSSLKTGGQNIVLFRGPNISTEDTLNKGDAWLLYKGCTEIEIIEVAVSWNSVT